MKKTLITILALALVLPVAVNAQPGPRDGSGPFCDGGPKMMHRNCDGPRGGGPGGMGGRMGHPGMGVLRFADEIGLTDQQREQMKTMTTEFQMERVDADANFEKAQIELRSLMRDEAGQADVDRAIDKVASLRAQKQKMAFRHHAAMKNILTEEQQTKLKQLRQDAWNDDDATPGRGMRGHRGGGHGAGGGWGNP